MLSPDQIVAPRRNRRLTVAGIVSIVFGTGCVGAGMAGAATPLSHLLDPQGRSNPASANLLSEHEIEVLDSLSPQSQAELLLERSINHYRGANEQIGARVDSWRGTITLNTRLNNLFVTALNSDDLRVRTAAIEVDLAARNTEKTSATVDRLEPDARFGEQGRRVNALWDLALVGNRGIEPARIGQILLSSIHDSNEHVRYWAVEGLAYLGTDETIAPLLEVFHDDPSPKIRERAACSLAQSGMLTERQRRTVVPQLLDFAERMLARQDERALPQSGREASRG